MWLITLLLCAGFAQKTINLLFVAVCLWAAFGPCPRKVALTSAALYLLLVLI